MIGQKNFNRNVCTRFIKAHKKQKYNSLIDPAFVNLLSEATKNTWFI